MQGFLWRALAPWADSVVYSIPFWWTRTISGLMIIFGQGFLFYNMWMTARLPAPTPSQEPVAAAA